MTSFLHLNVKDYVLICICCTSKSGALLKFSSCKHTGFLANYIDLESEIDLKSTYICNICHNMLKKIEVFKQQAEESIALLLNQATKLKINRLHNFQCSPVEIDSVATTEIVLEVKPEYSECMVVETPLDVKVESEALDKETEPVEEIKRKKQKRTKTDSKTTFKIVQTIQNGEFHLWTVPDAWENGGILRMPKEKIEVLRRDATSIPEGSWQNSNCILKKSGFTDFETAETERKEITEMTENVIDQANNVPNITHQSIQQNFNSLAMSSDLSEDIMTPNSSTEQIASNEIKALNSKINRQIAALHSKIDGQIAVLNSKIDDQIAALNSKSDGQIAALKSEIDGQMAALNSKIDRVMEPHATLSSNQDTVMQALSTLTTKFDELIKRSPSEMSTKCDNSKIFQPIANETILDELEQSLKNKENTENLIKTLSVVCGEGKGRAISNAYALIDAMFDRKFLQNCSWAGGSRGKESKICFKSYARVIDLFFQIVYLSDRTFTQLECRSFFQNILKNAKRRNEAKKLRASSQKRRPKRTKINSETDNANLVDVINMSNDQIEIVHEDVTQGNILVKVEETSEDNETDYLL